MIPSELLGNVEEFQSAYLWLMIIGSLAAFLMAFGIGANDVANSFGTSVGSGSVSFRLAVAMAAVCETVGAVALGASVTATVRKGIVDVELFKYNPELLMAGMFAALLSAGIWLVGCSHFGLPVSTTHSIIGSLIGMGIATAPASVQWGKVGLVVLSWLTSPLLSGILSSIVYIVIRWAIMRRGENGPKYALRFYPCLLFILFLAISLLGAFKLSLGELKAYRKRNFGIVFGIAVAIAFGLALIAYLLTIKWMKGKIERANITSTKMDLETSSKSKMDRSSPVPSEDVPTDTPSDETGERSESSFDGAAPTRPESVRVGNNGDNKNNSKSKLGMWLNVKENMKGDTNLEDGLDDKTKMLRDEAEIFPRATERVFNYLQVTSACFSSIAHGSNDTANAIGPLAAMISLFEYASVQSKADTPWWVSLLGGVSISVGLLLYGYKVLKTIGVNLCKVTPSRGFSMEIGASFVVVAGSTLGIPLSTTHCKVGATMGVGLCETKSIWNIKGVNIGLFGKIVAGWLITLIFTAGLSIIVYTILGVLLFPRIEAHLCGDLSASLALLAAVSTSGLIPEYSDPTTLQTYLASEFTKLDSNDDGFLTQTELEVKTAKDVAKKGLGSFGENSKMSKQQFSDWRCGGNELNTMQDGCAPLCADESLVAQPVECRWVEKKFAGKSYNLIAQYDAGVGCRSEEVN